VTFLVKQSLYISCEAITLYFLSQSRAYKVTNQLNLWSKYSIH